MSKIKFTEEQLAVLSAEIKSGKMKKSKLASRWKISRTTLDKYIEDMGIEFGEDEFQLDKEIEVSTRNKMVAQSANLLVDINDKYSSNSDKIEELTMKNLNKFGDMLDNCTKLSNHEVGIFLSSQRFLSEAASTCSIIFNDRRKAMGLDKGDASLKLQVENNTTNNTLNVTENDAKVIKGIFDEITE